MTRVRRWLLTAVVWLTAATTLIGGVPHFDCVCPNGNHKPFCFGFGCGGNGCCCAGSCCSCAANSSLVPGSSTHSAKATQSKSPCCCHKAKQPPRVGPNPSPQMQCPGCHKTLIQAELVVAPTEPNAAQLFTAEWSVIAVGIPLDLVVPSPAGSWTVWEPHRLPPPTDLVIALRHFLI